MNMNQNDKSATEDDERVKWTTHIACATCAAVAVQPIPFADIFILTPIQAGFGMRIAAIRGVPALKPDAEDLTKKIIAICGMGFAAQQIAIGVWKLITLNLGAFLTVPLVYSLTYAIMRVIDAYYSAKAKGEELSKKQMRSVDKDAYTEGKEQGKEHAKNLGESIMTEDKVINAIKSGAIERDDISIKYIRDIAIAGISGGDPQVRKSLARGRAILTTQSQLDQYWYTHALRIESQWKEVLRGVTIPTGNIEVVDYACGQGLATILFIGVLYECHDGVSKIHLIEPSAVALERAKHILECYCPESRIISVNKRLDDIVEADIALQEDAAKVHLFSNILDIEGFDSLKLLDKVFSKTNKGFHHILAVSHDREFAGGTPCVRKAYRFFIGDEHMCRHRTIVSPKWKEFPIKNSNNEDVKSVAFTAQVEVK